MLSVHEIKGTVENPDIADQVNEFLDSLSDLKESEGLSIKVFDIKYDVVHDIESGINISSAMIIFYAG